MNSNQIIIEDWSNPDSKQLYLSNWPQEPEVVELYENGLQCGGCSFYANFNADFGLCCHPQSRHQLETVFEHFVCPVYTDEGWGPHSFTTDENYHCRCGGQGAD